MKAAELKRLGGGRGAERRAREAAASLAGAAVDAGLLDVAYAFADSPFGPLLVAVGRRGLLCVGYPNDDLDQTLSEIAREVSPRVLQWAPATDEVRRELDEYFAGARRSFDVPVDLALVHGAFVKRVLEATARIPFGRVLTYRDVATQAGNALAVRAAGNALGSNPIPIVVPCHRVVRTGGGLGGYTGGLDRKKTLLTIEGVLGR
jgi:methylated-DNA-[protein]-cysteine S-methyltransferase